MVRSIRERWDALQKLWPDTLGGKTQNEEHTDPEPDGVEEQHQLQQELTSEGRSTALLYEIVGKLEKSMAESKDLANVLWVDDPARPSESESSMDMFRVRVIASANAARIGAIGYALQEESEAEYYVVFTNGDHGEYMLHDGTSQVPAEAIARAPLSSKTAVVSLAGTVLEISLPENVTVIPGDVIRLDSKKHFSGVAKWAGGAGDIVTVESILEGNKYVVTADGVSKRLVGCTPAAGIAEVGDQVVLDTTGRLILRNLGKADLGFQFREDANITWDDVIGQTEAKEMLQQVIELPHQRPDIVKALGMKKLKGGLLVGPPGCGKTRLAKAAANAMLRQHGEEALKRGFFFIKAPELLASLVGQGEALIRHIFAQALAFFVKTGIQPFMFIDEIDGIGKVRGSGISSDATDTLVNTLLTEIDESPAFVLAATNRHLTLDPALTRPGRLTEMIVVSRPTREDTVAMFTYYFKGVTLDNISADELAKQATDELYSDRYPLYKLTVTTPDQVSQDIQFGLADLNSGALVDWGIMERAKRIAAQRIRRNEGPLALQLADIVAAIAAAFAKEQLNDHTDALREYSEQRPDEIITATKLYQGRKK